MIVNKYLYHVDLNARFIAFVGLTKLLMAGRIGRPEFMISRLIVILYKSYDATDKKSEDFHIKIYEIMFNFTSFYLGARENIKHFQNAILIILSGNLLNDNRPYDVNVLKDYAETRFEYLTQLLIFINEHAINLTSPKKLIMKIFKYLYFIYMYSEKEPEEGSNKRNFVSYNGRKLFRSGIKRIIERGNFDKFIINEMNDDNIFKIFPYIHNLYECGGLKNFSDLFYEKYESLKNNNFEIDLTGRSVNLKERINELNECVSNKQIKYFKLIDDFYQFILIIKDEKLNVIYEESSRIEDNLEEEEEQPKTNSSNNNISNKITNKNKSLRNSRNSTRIETKIQEEKEEPSPTISSKKKIIKRKGSDSPKKNAGKRKK